MVVFHIQINFRLYRAKGVDRVLRKNGQSNEVSFIDFAFWIDTEYFAKLESNMMFFGLGSIFSQGKEMLTIRKCNDIARITIDETEYSGARVLHCFGNDESEDLMTELTLQRL